MSSRPFGCECCLDCILSSYQYYCDCYCVCQGCIDGYYYYYNALRRYTEVHSNTSYNAYTSYSRVETGGDKDGNAPLQYTPMQQPTVAPPTYHLYALDQPAIAPPPTYLYDGLAAPQWHPEAPSTPAHYAPPINEEELHKKFSIFNVDFDCRRNAIMGMLCAEFADIEGAELYNIRDNEKLLLLRSHGHAVPKKAVFVEVDCISVEAMVKATLKLQEVAAQHGWRVELTVKENQRSQPGRAK